MLQSIATTQQVMMLTSSFHGLTGLAQQNIKDAIAKYPHLEDFLPTLASYPVAFSNLRVELTTNKPTNTTQRITCIRATKEEITKWSWNSTPDVPFVEGFSIQSVGVAQQGHDAQNEGAIALKQNGTIEISNTATTILHKANVDAQGIYNAFINSTGSLEVRKAYDRFVKSLSVKATHLAGGCIIVENTERQRVEEYLEAIRMAGIKSQFISKFEVLLANNEQAIKEAIEHKAQTFINELEEKMKNAMRESTLKSESDTMIALMDMLNQYGIGQGLIEACSKVNEKINDQIKVIQDKHNNSKKAAQDTQEIAQDTQEIAQDTQEIAQDNTQKKRGRKPKIQAQEIAQDTQEIAQGNAQEIAQGTQEIAQGNAQEIAQDTQEIAQDTQEIAQDTQDNAQVGLDQDMVEIFNYVQDRNNSGYVTPFDLITMVFQQELVQKAIDMGLVSLNNNFVE